MNRTKKLAQFSLMVTLALILSYVESQIPALIAVPGVKLGLTNLVVLVTLYCIDRKSAIIINIIRIFLVGLLFGNGMSLLFSLAGGILSGLVMILLYSSGKFSILLVSIAGGIAHNIGQILVAMLVLQTNAIAWYLLILWFSGIISGALIGLIGGMLCQRLEPMFKKQNT